MKKSISKKVLALFLAVLMVVTAVPFMAFAGTETEYNAVANAIKFYQESMANGYIYRGGMENAYNKYLSAKKLADAYQYGNNKNVSFGTAASELTAAVNTMKNNGQYSAPGVSADKEAKWVGGMHTNDAEDIQTAAELSNKLLYADNFNGDMSSGDIVPNALKILVGDYSFDNKQNFTQVYLQSGDVVMLYDGTDNHPQYPVGIVATSWGSGNNNPELWSVYPVSSPGIRVYKPYRENAKSVTVNGRTFSSEVKQEMWDAWIGGVVGCWWYQDCLDGNSSGPVQTFISGTNEESTKHPGYPKWYEEYNNSAGNFGSCKSRLNNGSTRNFRCFSSTIRYTGTPSKYAEYINVTWGAMGWDDGDVIRKGTATDNIHKTGVVNWKAIQDLATKARGWNTLKNITTLDSKSSDIITMLKYIDFVTSFNPDSPKSFSGQTLQYSNVNTLDTINTDMQNANNAIKDLVSTDNYQELRNVIDAGIGTNTSWTTDSWNTYVSAFNAAVDHFATVGNLYNSAEAGRLNTAIATAKENCVNRANFTEYNAAKKYLLEGKYSVSDLDNLKLSFDNDLFNLTNDKQLNTPYSEAEQKKLSDQANAMNSLKNVDTKTYDAGVLEVQDIIANANNNDKYNLKTVKEELAEALDEKNFTQEVTLSDDVKLKGYNYDNALEHLKTALNEAQYLYTVTVKDGDETTTIENPNRDDKKFVYGDTVKVGEAEYNSKVKPGRTATWMEPVYIGSTDKIVVRGDTVLTKCTGTGENVKVVKFVSGGQVYDIQSTTESPFDLSKANIYAPSHYTVSGYKVGDETYDVNGQLPLNETGTTEVTVLFKADTKLGEVTVNNEKHTFGEKVTLNSKDGSEVGFYAANGDHLWNGTSYTFYARETVTIEEGKTLDIVGAHTSRIEPSNGKVYFYGGISNADESNVLSQGMIIELDGEGTKDLTLAAVDGVTIFNVTAQRIDSVTKQYSISMPENAASKVRCRAYVAYKTTEDGKEVINYVYSNATQVYPAPSNEVTA